MNNQSVMDSIFGSYQGVRTALEVMNCPSCGTPFGIEQTLLEAKRRNGGSFFCPNGHVLTYTKTEIDKLKEQLAKEAKVRERLESEAAAAKRAEEYANRQRAAAKGQLTKERNRIAKGVCPCCNRQFSNLHRHMTTQHPQYTQEEAS